MSDTFLFSVVKSAFALGLCLTVSQNSIWAQSTSQNKDSLLTVHAIGMFEVTMNPLEEQSGYAVPGRIRVDKQFNGGFTGESQVYMVYAYTPVKGSGVYVAVEFANGTLNGRKGSFVLHHVGVLTRGAQQLSVSVVPDSGTDQLVGLSGMMTIKISEGKHFYDFEYTLKTSLEDK